MSEVTNSIYKTGTVDLFEAADPFSVGYVNSEEYLQIKSRVDTHVLAGVQFGCERDLVFEDDNTIRQIAIPSVESQRTIALWLSSKPVTYQNSGLLSLASNGQVLVGHISCDYYRGGIEENTHRCYRELLEQTTAAGYPYLLRLWNYIPDINSDDNGLESYQRFTLGRYRAFKNVYKNVSENLPAATAVGITDENLLVGFIAGKRPGVFLENPRQVSAYHYPKKYGPRSPSFARATYQRWGQKEILFISGTASIFGHESQHPGDVRRQLQETFKNIESVIEHAINQRHLHAAGGLHDLTGVKVFLRNLTDYELIRPLLEKHLNSGIDLMVLQADICRIELMVEVEAMVNVNLDDIRVVPG
ncbi:hypothetical protein ACFL17_04415 [Pseudomonadota bacterium]